MRHRCVEEGDVLATWEPCCDCDDARGAVSYEVEGTVSVVTIGAACVHCGKAGALYPTTEAGR
jgi:hypothetical protein